MEKRAYQRVPEKIRINFYYANEMYEGTVKDISQNGLHIDAEVCPPFESTLEVVLILGDEVFKLPSKVKRLENPDELRGSMGVELSAPSRSYCEFVTTVQNYHHRKPL